MSVPYFYKNSNSKFLSIDGKDKSEFLQNLITNDINKCQKDKIIYACLLSPQGKFISDFFIFESNNMFILETHSSFFEILIQKLKVYKLRSNININKIDIFHSFNIFSDISKDSKTKILSVDPRNKNIGNKMIHESASPVNLKDHEEIEEDKYHEILINNTVPLSHYDLEENKSLLLENNFENLNAIDWNKGCYVGQEITARMKYRALLKKRIFALNLKSGYPKNNQIIEENGKAIGKIISKKNNAILAMLKIDIATNKKNFKIPIKTDDGLLLDFI